MQPCAGCRVLSSNRRISLLRCGKSSSSLGSTREMFRASRNVAFSLSALIRKSPSRLQVFFASVKHLPHDRWRVPALSDPVLQFRSLILVCQMLPELGSQAKSRFPHRLCPPHPKLLVIQMQAAGVFRKWLCLASWCDTIPSEWSLAPVAGLYLPRTSVSVLHAGVPLLCPTHQAWNGIKLPFCLRRFPQVRIRPETEDSCPGRFSPNDIGS